MDASKTYPPIHYEETDIVLEETDAQELRDLGRVVKNDSLESEGQTKLFTSLYYFIFLKTGAVALQKAIAGVEATPVDHRERAVRLSNLGNELVRSFEVHRRYHNSPPNVLPFAANDVTLQHDHEMCSQAHPNGSYEL
jgi:nitrate reductase cytochrome c-type subunit